MIQAQVELTEEHLQRLQELAARYDVSVSELVRRGVERVLQEGGDRDEDKRWERASSVVGCFRSGVDDLAVNHDKYLDDAFSATE